MTLAELRAELTGRFRQSLAVQFENEDGMLVGLDVVDIQVRNRPVNDKDSEETLVISLSGGRFRPYKTPQEVPPQYGISKATEG